MFKNLFTRRNLIGISVAFFFGLIFIVTGLALDVDNTMKLKTSIFYKVGNAFGFGKLALSRTGLACVIVLGVYIFVFITFFIMEKRYAKLNKIKSYSRKMIVIYSLTLAICLGLSVGFGFIIQGVDNAFNYFAYVGQTLLISVLVFLALGGLVFASLMIIFNLINIDKPLSFGTDEEKYEIDEENDVTSNFENKEENEGGAAGAGVGGIGGAGGSGEGGGGTLENAAVELSEREKVFPGLSVIDITHNGYKNDNLPRINISLKELSTRFRNYLAKVEKLYYDEDTIRFFIAGLGTSHFSILEGLSGTGKSSLPRYFAKFVNANYLLLPVQTTWRDRSNLLGYFNDFSHTYSETELLLEIYKANYDPDRIQMFVLDEMNISRVEYYFADFLSVLEGPKDTWKLKLMQLPYGFIPPVQLEDGYITITPNTYFVGTANKDDSTFQIADKVYDRAITIDFVNRNPEFEVTGNFDPITLSSSELDELFEVAKANKGNQLNEEDYERLHKITDYIYDEFDLTFGNRIANQMENLVPVFVACGGTKEDAIDFLLTRKVLAKLEGRFEDYVKGALRKLLVLIEKTYGAGSFKRSVGAINRLIRRL